VNYTIIPTHWQQHHQLLKKIREQVFIQEQQVPVADEWDAKDDTAIHFLVNTDAGKAVACARLLLESDGHQNLCHIGRVAVLADYREQGIGRTLMVTIINYCKNAHLDYKIYLHAQTTRQRFYEHLGFAARGAVFMDAGIPHIEMWLS
jgi:predicted GNAT family N-acyltransferase